MITRGLKGVFVVVLTLITLFGWSAGIGGLIVRNGDWVEPDPKREKTVPLLVISNGIHTEIVMPQRAAGVDWLKAFPLEDITYENGPYSQVSVSWGERTFFLETETWSDLDLTTAFAAMTGGEAVLHVAHYIRGAPSRNYRKLHLSLDEYRRLAAEIQSHLKPDYRINRDQGYGVNDTFYPAKGTYHLGNTCNQWTSDQLAGAGVKIGWWTPLPGGVLHALPKPEARN